MEVSINSNINQLYSSSVRMIAIDSKMIAFYTILTVALSLMLSFKQSRCLLKNATTQCSLFKVKKCLKCFKGFKVLDNKKAQSQQQQQHFRRTHLNNEINQDCINNNSNITTPNITGVSYCFGYTKYLKLKRLRTIASIATKFTANTLRSNSVYYYQLFKRFRSFSFVRMRKSLPQTNGTQLSDCKAQQTRRVLSRFRRANNINENFCPTCETEEHVAKSLKTSSSMPVFSIDHTNITSSNNNSNNFNLHRSSSSNKIYNSKVRLYKKLPLRSMSRAWGEINSIDLPIWCRKPCFYFYSWMFNCNLNEIDIEDLNEFKNLSEFFRRGLKPDSRIIDQQSCLVSPCDGKILNFGIVDKGYLEQVKGVNYSLKAFLGPQNWPKTSNPNEPYLNNSIDDAQYEQNILKNPDNRLFHCVIYLAPGDYHRFHSPTDWNIYYRRHFPGELFSVNPSVARWLQGLFNLNERVVYYGEWKYGFFSMTAVGATNVGSIRVYKDEGLTTNCKKSKTIDEKDLDKNFLNNVNPDQSKGIPINRGDSFGEFNLGSTIVLIFEAPKTFEFNIQPNEKVFFGSQMGSSTTSTYL